MALDGGASGIIVPYVERGDQVRQLVCAVKLRPLKGRVLQDVLFDEAALPCPLQTDLDDANAGNALIVNVEGRPASRRSSRFVGHACGHGNAAEGAWSPPGDR